MSKQPVQDPIEKRVEMINGYFTLPENAVKDMKEIREAISVCAHKLQEIFKRNNFDTGRAIAAIDLLQSAKNTACDALILPHAEK